MTFTCAAAVSGMGCVGIVWVLAEGKAGPALRMAESVGNVQEVAAVEEEEADEEVEAGIGANVTEPVTACADCVERFDEGGGEATFMVSE